MNIQLPHLGDGIESAVVLAILVKPGEAIKKEQPILELETDKAVAAIPAPSGGIVETVLVAVGDTVRMGTPVLSVSGGESLPVDNSGAASPTVAPVASSSPNGTGPAGGGASVAPMAPIPPHAMGQYTAQGNNHTVVTSPTIRQLADVFGLDITRITGTGMGGRVTVADVKAYVSHIQYRAFETPSPTPTPTATAPTEGLPDFGKWGEIERRPLPSLRKKIAAKMSQSWSTVPHVTQFDEADITHIMALRKKHVAAYEKAGCKLTVTGLVIKAVAKTLSRFLQFNATLDTTQNELIIKHYINLGIAVDTDNGLIVPVIKGVEGKSILALSKELAVVSEKARNRQIGVEDLQGGTFTISNLGSLGVGAFTPIVNTPEVAIVGLSKGLSKPVVLNGEVVIRTMLPISLSYDHRVIDGADAARFIRAMIEEIETLSESEVEVG
ncbi:MAG: branched-chain alpha-keto acid dehydrogenase subunit E2 [Betaproteobacteria bacterium]|nr:branched-chain alpha-keto acid dehydrogenase subunit E2 [Betaproteobacteria bacterium]